MGVQPTAERVLCAQAKHDPHRIIDRRSAGIEVGARNPSLKALDRARDRALRSALGALPGMIGWVDPHTIAVTPTTRPRVCRGLSGASPCGSRRSPPRCRRRPTRCDECEGRAGIRTLGRGFSPYNGLAMRRARFPRSTISGLWGIHLTGVSCGSGSPSGGHALSEVRGRVPGLVPDRGGLLGLSPVAAMARRLRLPGLRSRSGLAAGRWSVHVCRVRRPYLGDRGHDL